MAPDDTVNLRLRLPETLHKELVTEAEKNGRSLNSEIIWRLEKTLGESGRRLIAEIGETEKRQVELVETVMLHPEFRKKLAQLLVVMMKKEEEGRASLKEARASLDKIKRRSDDEEGRS